MDRSTPWPEMNQARLVGHRFEATRLVADLLGPASLENAVTDITAALLRADAFDARWVHVTLWEQDGELFQAITRYWDDGPFRYRTEVSLAEEGYGGFAACLAETVLDGLTSQQLGQAALDSARPLPTDPDTGWVLVRGPYRIVCLPAGAVLREELSRG